MSLISDRHNVVPFKPGKTAAFEGQRLAKIGYKTTEKTPAKFPSVAVSIPVVSDDDLNNNYERLLPYVRSMVEDAQDGIIRSLYESSDGTLRSVADSELSVECVINFLAAEAAGNRMKKDAVEAWFDSEVSELLSVVICEKLGTENMESPEVKKHIKVYRDLIGSLAGGKTMLQPMQIAGCRKALALIENECEISRKLNSRLDSMEKKEIAEVLDI